MPLHSMYRCRFIVAVAPLAPDPPCPCTSLFGLHGRNKGSAPRQIRRTDVAATAHTSSVQNKNGSGAFPAIGVAVVIVGHWVSSFFVLRLLSLLLAAIASKQKALILTLEDEGISQPSWYHHHSPLTPTHQEPHTISPPCRI